MFGSTTQPDEDDDADSDEESQENEIIIPNSSNAGPRSIEDEFNFDNYDNENTEAALKISDVVEVTEDDQIADSENDSEAEDDLIKPEDNLILVGRVEMDCASLEVYSECLLCSILGFLKHSNFFFSFQRARKQSLRSSRLHPPVCSPLCGMVQLRSG